MNSELRSRNIMFLIPPYRQIHAVERDKGYLLEMHEHEFYHLIVVTNGRVFVTVPDQTYHIYEGHACVIPPRLPHKIFTDEKYSQIDIDLAACDDERGVYQLFSQKFPDEFTMALFPDVLLNFEKVYEQLGIVTPLNTMLLVNMAERIVLDFVRNLEKDKNASFKKEFAALFSTEESGAFTPLTLVQICEKMNMSKTQLERLVNEEFSCSAIEYGNKLRLSKACMLLESSDYPIKSIGDMLGFYDESHFSSFFKKHMGVTPGRYRKNNYTAVRDL